MPLYIHAHSPLQMFVCGKACNACKHTPAKGILLKPNLHGSSAPPESTDDFCKLQICTLGSPFALAWSVQRGQWYDSLRLWPGLSLAVEGQRAFMEALAKVLGLGSGMKRPLCSCGTCSICAGFPSPRAGARANPLKGRAGALLQ